LEGLFRESCLSTQEENIAHTSFVPSTDDYRAHTSCITEAERYEGKLVKKQTKRNPQQEWMDIVTSCQETAPGPLKSHMRTMAGLDNIPRKEKQFRNFTSNSLNLRGKNGDAIVGEIWSVLSVERERRKAEKEKQQQEEKGRKETEKQEQVEKEDEDQSAKESKEVAEAESSIRNAELDPKLVQKAMKKALKQAPNRSMKLKELRRLLGQKLSLSKSAKKLLKKIMQDPPDTAKKSKVKVEGKLIMLV
jgi:cell growth-regulating nucleolar protein